MQVVVRDEIYRIGCEAIRNAAEHSGGTQLVIEMSCAGDFALIVCDNGKGIDLHVAQHGTDGHFGVRGMRERASRIGARLTIDIVPHGGTKVALTVPASILEWSPDAKSRVLLRLRSLFKWPRNEPPSM